jgi:hypothetical protein
MRATKPAPHPKIVLGLAKNACVGWQFNCHLSTSSIGVGAMPMRWTGWIMAAAMIAGCAGQASAQFGCSGCAGGWAPWQANWAYLSGEACCSPPGYSGGAICPGPCRSCCDNAWDGYCCHHARVQAWAYRVGVPKAPCCLGLLRRAALLSPACDACSSSTPEAASAITPARPLPSAAPTPGASATPSVPTAPVPSKS